jgi:hypothetical protein
VARVPVASAVVMHLAHGTGLWQIAAPIPIQHERPAGIQTAEESIGTATMEADGTIELRLIGRGPRGLRGERFLRYPPFDPKYKEILDHVGPLKRGEMRSVAPWPD